MAESGRNPISPNLRKNRVWKSISLGLPGAIRLDVKTPMALGPWARLFGPRSPVAFWR